VNTAPDTQTEPCPACGSVLDVTGAQIFAERTCPVCGTQINVRRAFGHYELIGVVGHGGQGIVYRAVDNTLNRLVALKLLRTEYSNDPEFVRQFESEARVTASINHPNVVRVFSFGSGEGHVFLAMELVDHGNFDELMEKLGRVPEARALQIGVEIARGLKAGYERGLIHRDVKPGNILFAEDSTAKIVDFGLAMFFEQEAAQTGEIWGTPYYLSPERLNRVQEDFRSDMYSLGATLFHAIAGRPPFEAEDASHVALKHLRTQAASIQAFAPDVSNATAYVINRTLAKNPLDRQQSYDEFIEQLQFAREEALARAKGGPQPKSRVVLDDVGSHRAMSWVTIATLIILVAGIAVGTMLVLKSVRGNKGDTGPVVEAGAATIDKFGKDWREAQTSLLNRNYRMAATEFGNLATNHPEGSTERSWAVVHQALAIQLGGDTRGAAAKLNELSGGGTQVSKFYHDQIAPMLASDKPVPFLAARDFSRTNHEAFGPLFLALKDFELGQVDDTRALIGQFAAMNPESSVAWMADYRNLAKPLQEELDSFSLAISSWTGAKTPRAREQALVDLRLALAKLPANSRFAPKIQQLIGEADKVVAADKEAKKKENIAIGARTTASTSHKSANKTDLPEQAVDGDPKTRWRNEEKDPTPWLALDLGAPKPISRWVIYTASAGGEKPENNLCEFKLQRSDDSKKWIDVDAVNENRAGITDRVVPEFTSRYVRVLGVRSVKSTDKNARIFELQLGRASDQPKAEYQPAENVAFRFSTASDFVAGPIGDPTVAGSVTYDGKEKRYTVTASGADIWNTSDSFEYAWQPIKGDCEIVACVRTHETKHDWTKAVVMVRSDLTKDASHCALAVGAGGKVQFMTRKERAKPTTSNIKNGTPLPRWIKVVRQGDLITGYESGDGAKWNEVGKETIVGLNDLAFVGFGLTSHAEGQVAKTVFSDVSITGAKP
jgi:hypothetical protein